MDSKNWRNNLIKVYVDASLGNRAQAGGDWGYVLVYFIEEQKPKKFNYDSSLNYLHRKIETDEAEYLAIIFALSNITGNLEVFSDNKQIICDLQKRKITSKNKNFVQRIDELSKDRVVKFEWVSRDINPAGRHLQGY